VVLGPLVGPLIDRWNRRKVMLIADAVVALFSAWLAYLFWTDALQIWQVYLIMAVRAIGGTFHWPAMSASTSLMVPEEHQVSLASQSPESLYWAVPAPWLGGNGSGSWSSPVIGDLVWVAQGIYRPSARTNPEDPRSATFELVNGVSMRGGYAGYGQPAPNVRSIDTYETTLSGDLGANDGPGPFDNYDENAEPADANTVLLKMVAEKAMIIEARSKDFLKKESISDLVKRFSEKKLVALLLQRHTEGKKINVTEDEITRMMEKNPKLDKARAKMTVENAKRNALINEYYKQIYESHINGSF